MHPPHGFLHPCSMPQLQVVLKIRAVLVSLLLAVPLLARPALDVIVMDNGDRITGEIKGLQGDVLTVSLPYVDGNLSMNWLRVARVDSPQLFLMQTQDGLTHTGTLTTLEASAADPIKIQIAEGTNIKATTEKSKVVRLTETSLSFRQRLSGDINLGSSYSKGNNTTQYQLGASIEQTRERWGASITYSSNLSASSGAETATRNQANLSAYRLLRRTNFFVSGFGGLLQSSVQGIHLQENVGAGIGRFFKNTNRTKFSVLGGGVWQTTKYNPSAVSVERQQVYGAIGTADLKVFLFKKTNLSITGSAIPAFSDRGRVFYSTNASYYLKFFRDFSWNFSFYGNWDTRPPPTFKGSDYGYSSGLKWTFGYK
jgi:hypothetical protein